MKLKTKIKEVPGLQYVADSMEVMSAAGRRRMLEQDFLTDAQQLSLEQNIVASVRQVLQTPAMNAHLIHLRHPRKNSRNAPPHCVSAAHSRQQNNEGTRKKGCRTN